MFIRAARTALETATALALAALIAGSAPARADSVVLVPVRDTTLYSESGSESNGAGEHLFAGRTGAVGGGGIRRALLAFDFSSIPVGSTITSVSLEMYCSKAAPGSPAQAVRLHRVTAAWGEGTSDANGEEGQGIAATNGDATWTSRFFGSLSPWTTAGGDHIATASATTSVGAPGFFYTWSSPGMLADVQAWIANPFSNHGWLVRGNEASLTTTRRFGSRQNGFDGFYPHLTVNFDPPLSSVGQVPNGDDVPGDPLTVAKLGPNLLQLEWGAGCVGASSDYSVYQGDLGSFTSHAPVTCSTASARDWTLAPPPMSVYWLVVPHHPGIGREGSYGQDSDGSERAPALAACRPQFISAQVCP